MLPNVAKLSETQCALTSVESPAMEPKRSIALEVRKDLYDTVAYLRMMATYNSR